MIRLKSKNVWVLLFFLKCVASESKAQTWDELFRQKETQRDYLIIQIGALEIQSQLLAESASISRLGLDAIGNWKGLENEIHTEFFDSYKSHGPISQTEYERTIRAQVSPEHLFARIESSKHHWQGKLEDVDDLKFNRKLHESLKVRCLRILEELRLILGSELEISDGDRAKLITSAGKKLTLIQSDLMRLQVLYSNRVWMKEQQAKWQKDLSIY